MEGVRDRPYLCICHDKLRLQQKIQKGPPRALFFFRNLNSLQKFAAGIGVALVIPTGE